MENLLSIISIGLIYVLFCNYNPKTNYAEPRFWLFLQIVGFVLSYFVAINFNISVGVMLLYLYSSSLYLGFFNLPTHQCTNYGNSLNYPFQFTALKTSIIILASMSVFLMDYKYVDMLLITTPYVTILASIWSLLPLKWLMYTPDHKRDKRRFPIYGFSLNSSVNATFISLLASCSFVKMNINDVQFYSTICGLILALSAIIRMRASSGLGSILASVFSYVLLNALFVHSIDFFVILLALLSISIPLGAIIHKRYGKSLFSLSRRDEIIKYSFKNLFSKDQLWFGNGIGTYRYMMPTKQTYRTYKLKKDDGYLSQRKMAWMHCDVLQFFIEGGVVGSALALFVVASICFVVPDKMEIIPFFLAYIVASLTNFTNHIASDTILLIAMLKYTFEGGLF